MKKHSKTNHCHCSTGETISRAELERRINKAKELKVQQQKDGYGYNFCEMSIMHDVEKNCMEYRILDCSHIVSIKECIESGRSELAADVDNIRILCRHCHKVHDKVMIFNKLT